jgi:uncharacterized protein (TIGR00369 family)
LKKDPRQGLQPNFCYICGADNPKGMRLKFSVDSAEPAVRGFFSLARHYQGPPACAHGGVIASLVDEAMGKLNKIDGVRALTAEITVEYLRPVPLGRRILVEARPSEHRGRNYWRECTIRDAKGKLLVRGRGRFVKVQSEPRIQSEPRLLRSGFTDQ